MTRHALFAQWCASTGLTDTAIAALFARQRQCIWRWRTLACPAWALAVVETSLATPVARARYTHRLTSLAMLDP